MVAPVQQGQRYFAADESGGAGDEIFMVWIVAQLSRTYTETEI